MRKNNLDKRNIETERKKIARKEVNKFLNNNFKWFIALVVVVIFIFGFLFLIKPKHEETLKLIKIINEQGEMDVEAKQEELEKIKDFLLAYSKIEKKYIDKVNAIAPLVHNKEELFTELNHIVSKSGLLLRSISLGEGSEHKKGDSTENNNSSGGNMKKITIQLGVEGTDYETFKSFLASLENNLKLMDVINVTFNPGSRTTSLSIDTYYIE